MSKLPISVVIIGVGDENFTFMKKLDNIEEVRKKASEEDKSSIR